MKLERLMENFPFEAEEGFPVDKDEKEQRNIPITELRNETGIAWTTPQSIFVPP